MIDQGYDGASFTSKKEKGIQAIVKESGPLARLYVHCSTHVLNLVLVKSREISEIHRTFDLGDTASFLNQAVKETHD